MNKSDLIKQTLKETKERRTIQICKVFELKIDSSRLNTTTKNQLSSLFREGRWMYNHLLNLLNQTNDFNQINTTNIKTVLVKRKDIFEEELITTLSSQMKQSLFDRIKQSIINLSKLKKKGKKIGTLKFKDKFYFNCIPLKQFNNTYKFVDGKIKIQNIKQLMRVNGLEQIKENYEIANANLIKKQDDYYLKVTCFINKEDLISINPLIDSVGIDFGITTQLTLSTGQKIEYNIPTSKRTKFYQKQLKRKVKNSKNYNKIRNKIQKSHNKTNNIKKDIVNKVVNYLITNFKYIIIQDENLKFFQKNFGKKIQGTRLKGIITKLKHLDTSIVVSKFFSSTKLCFCGYKNNNIKLSDRIFDCPVCKISLDRDYKSSLLIQREGLLCSPNICTERTNFNPVEYFPSVSNIGNSNVKIRKIRNIFDSNIKEKKQEA